MDYYSVDIIPGNTEVEVFESKVVPKQPKKNVVKTPDNDEIKDDRISTLEEVPFLNSRSLFEEKLTESKERIALKRKATLEETRREKLFRIRNELLDLKNDGDANGDEQEVSGLLKLLDELNSKDVVKITKWKDSLNVELPQKTFKEQSLSITSSSSPETDTSVEQLSGLKILGLDNRLNNLESQLGSLSADTTTNMTLESIVNDIYRRLNLLANPSHSTEEIKKELDDLIQNSTIYLKNLNRIKQLEPTFDQSHITPLTDTKINFIYEKLTHLPNFMELLPLVLNRLKTIEGIVIRLNESANSIEGLNEELNKMDLKVDEWSDKLDVLDKKWELSNGTFKIYKERIDEKLRELSDTIKNRAD